MDTTSQNKHFTTNTYKEIYIRLMLDTIKLQIGTIKERGGPVKLLNAVVKGAGKFLNHTISNIHVLEQTTTNLEILKRTVNAMRNLCLAIEKNPPACSIKIINRLLIKNFRIFFPCNFTTKQLFKDKNGNNFPCDFFKGLVKVPSIKFLSKLIKKALSKEDPATNLGKNKWQKLKEQFD